MIARIACAILLGGAIAGCSGPASVGSGTVSGHVMVRACGGAYRPDQTSCPTRPLAGARVSFQANGKSFTATVDSSGAYRIDLKPSTYTAEVAFRNATVSSPNLPVEPFPRVAGPRQITVMAGKTVTADFTFNINLL